MNSGTDGEKPLALTRFPIHFSSERRDAALADGR
jgi:hypothetical protein